MIVRIEASGSSFLGAGRYYLHDKQAEGERKLLRDQGDERVWFTDTRNCLNVDPERALEEMWHTAESQAELKMQAGVPRGGRHCEEPVKTISLSWHKDDRPDVQHMVDQADAFLKHMGWDGHQAVYVGHSDTEHRHIHIILNRVSHETGRTLDDYKERKRAQAWALSYEKQQENVRCEERELRAAKREHRAPELNEIGRYAADAGHAAQPTRSPANDHLPHNVVVLARPHERQFAADEQERARTDGDDRAELKAHQRAEREAFFKDGAKLFKATRHAAYDEVRRAFKDEWKQYYADAKTLGQEADAASRSAITRAYHFAKDGRWQEARSAFGDRDAVRRDVEHDLSERKADILARQKGAIAEHQRDACDALRQVREVHYQELLQRQRGERAAVAAGTSLEALGIGDAPDQQKGAVIRDPEVANQNQASRLDQAIPVPDVADKARAALIEQAGRDHLASNVADLGSEEKAVQPAPATQGPRNAEATTPEPTLPSPEAAPLARQVSDLAAGAIGSVASYLADQLGELFAPTPPELREAQAKADAKQAQDQPERHAISETASAYADIIAAALKVAEAERAAAAEDAHWKERDRGKDWERDR